PRGTCLTARSVNPAATCHRATTSMPASPASLASTPSVSSSSPARSWAAITAASRSGPSRPGGAGMAPSSVANTRATVPVLRGPYIRRRSRPAVAREAPRILPAVRTILVVDDERNIVDLVRLYLEKEGFAVLSAADGETALAIHARQDPDLVILDVMLPKI